MHQCFEEITKRWERPLFRPVRFDMKTGEASGDKWALQMYNITKAGNMSGKGKAVLYIEHCPICGEKLSDEAQPADKK